MKLTRETLRKIKIRHIFGIQQTWSYDRMMGSGYCWAMLPGMEQIYQNDPEGLRKTCVDNIQFFNTSAIFSPLITGVHLAMMEADQEAIGQNIKTAMMGPLAGVGDTLAGVIINPVTTLIACQFALTGNWLLSLGLILGVRIGWIIVQSKLFDFGYAKGVEAIESTTKNSLVTSGIELVTMFGAVILGGFIPSMLSGIQIGLEYTSAISLEGQQADKIFRVQEMFDNIAPYLVPIGLVAGLLWLIKKKNMTSTQILILIFVLAAVCYFTKLLIVA